MKLFFPLSLLAFLCGCAAHAPLPTVSGVDLARYAGRWYEVASLPNRFQQGCFASTADYRLLDNGELEVINRCRVGSLSGKESSVTGRAWAVGEGKLKVQFFWPFSGDYWILALAPDYHAALIGNPSRKYLWVLSRTPQLAESEIEGLLAKAVELGYRAGDVQRTVQEVPRDK